MNLGQLVWVLRAHYLVDAISYPKIQGKPFKQSEIEAKIEEVLGIGPAVPRVDIHTKASGNGHGPSEG